MTDRKRRPPASVPPPADLERIRRRFSESSDDDAGAAILYARDIPRTPPRPASPPELVAPAVDLAEAVEGRETAAPHGGRAFVICRPVSRIQGGWEALSAVLAEALADETNLLRAHLPGQSGPVSPAELIFFDLETTGLATGGVFLIGAMVWEGGQLCLKQFFARNYAEERAILSLFLAEAASKKLLVSFNGKSFDLPFIRVRSAACRVPFAPAWAHMDLLHVSRRIWGGRFDNCKLQTLERHICRRHRADDIPASAIPEAYHQYVRTGNGVHMVTVIEHNLLDLLTLAELMTRMPEPE